ncbi:band 4.1-like protein 4B [Mirounga leonina]|nr:band 4.1-like protein 4B [Mirounga leonina]
MDFTEATPLIKTFPVDPVTPFPDAFNSGPQFTADFRDSKLPCCPGQSSPLIPAVTLRPLTETISTVQTIYPTRKPVSLAASAETLRQELEREKMMKRLLMTEL